MRILHYSLGFPPYRSGGLTKFCIDLIREQKKTGHKVFLLWPGRMSFLRNNTRIIRGKDIDGIGNLELADPLPVPFDEGISDFDSFTAEGDKAVFERFLAALKPDVIHIHTFMGLPRSFLDAARERGIRLVFTAHDFYPICPKVKLFRNGGICGTAESCAECGQCNSTALSLKKIMLLQSPAYRALKDSAPVRALRKRHRDSYLSDAEPQGSAAPVGTAADFRALREYYAGMLSLVDMIHYNSTVTKAVYEQFFGASESKVISISHSDIRDRRRLRYYRNGRLRIRYLGPCSAAKGYYLLREALDELWRQRQDLRLDVHFEVKDPPPYLRMHPRYGYKDLEYIFDRTDVLVAPSILYETFGYTVLEALSFGVPVVISGTVGARDILADGAGIITEDNSVGSLLRALQSLDAAKLNSMNRRIVDAVSIPTAADMAETITEKVYGK